MERKNLIRSALTVMGLSNRAASHRGIRLAPLLLAAVMLAAVTVLAVTSNPSRTAQAQNYGNVVCQSPPAVSCTYDDVSAEPTTHWATTMTVGAWTEHLGGNLFRQNRGYTLPGRGVLGLRSSHTVTMTTPSKFSEQPS